jgi:hypothetical protein
VGLEPRHVLAVGDGRVVVSRDAGEFLAWDARTGRLLHRSPLTRTDDGSFDLLLPGGRLLTADRVASLFRVRDARTGRETFRFEGRPDVGEPAVAPGGRYVAVRGKAGEVCVLDLETGRCADRFDPGAAPGLKLAAGGNVLVWHRRVSRGLEVCVLLATGKTLSLGPLPQTDDLARWLDRGPCLSPDGRWLVVFAGGGTLRRWDLTAGKELPPLPGVPRTVWGLFWSSDGRLVAAHGSAAPANVIDPDARQDVRVWDVAAGKQLPHFDLPGHPGAVLFTRDGRTLLTTDLEGAVHLWEVATGKERRRLRGHLAGPIDALALGPDGRMLASGGCDSQVLVWDLTGRAPDGVWRPAHPSAEERRAAWEALAGADARAAYAAVWALAADPEGTTAFLRERLRPVERADPARLRRLIADLDHDEFAVRRRAEGELADMGEAASAGLREAQAQAPSAEARRRLRGLVERLEGTPQGKELQALRGVEVLEHVGTPEARRLLEALSRGAPEARLTREAKAALR